MYRSIRSHAPLTPHRRGSRIELGALPSPASPRAGAAASHPLPPIPSPPAQGDAQPGSCPPFGSHSPVNTEGMGRGGEIMVHGINLGVVCIFIALASDSSLQKGFKKD